MHWNPLSVVNRKLHSGTKAIKLLHCTTTDSSFILATSSYFTENFTRSSFCFIKED